MLSNYSILNNSSLRSVIGSQSQLHPDYGLEKKEINADLLLTALIDAFSILVIFLLMSFSSTGELLFMSKDTELPKAARSETLERNPVVKIEGSTVYLEDKEMGPDELIPALIALRKQFAETRPNEEYPGIITVQADRRLKYEVLNQVVVSASGAGFGDIRFAVLMK